MYTTIINSEVLKKHLKDPEFMVFDCRFNLADKHYGEKAYVEGHIPGAHYLYLDYDLSSPITPDSGRHPLPDVKQLAEKLASLGMNKTSQVVAYDDCGGAMAVRVWWLLRWMGHTSVAVLNGGFPYWLEQQGEVSSEIPEPTGKGDFKPDLQDGFIVDTPQLVSSLQKWLVVDARAEERFRGENEPIDPIAGRIPGSVNRPLMDNLENGVFKTAEQLCSEWQSILKDTDPATVVHLCGSGVTACHNQLALEIAGITNTRLYPGSWSEWIRDPSRPIATG